MRESRMLLLLSFGDRIPNQAALALSPTLGWWGLGCAALVFLLFITLSDRWRRYWLTLEDPRSLALFRIVFGFFLICNVNGMHEYFVYLFTDEGIFPADIARRVHASAQFVGFGDGWTEEEPWGFFDLSAFVQFLKGPKYSLLYIWDSPTFFWGYLVAFEVTAISFMLGFKTRVTGVATWFLMNGLLVRNHVMWEGTELVYRCFLAYLVVARSGHAYSIDNWLRCRKLRHDGQLSEPGGAGDGAGVAPNATYPRGLEAIYRLVPAWPRRLMMLQLAALYVYTGTVKTGPVWMAGDSLYYALNLDHFHRFPPQLLSSYLGTTVFRGLTWFVKIGQCGFGVVILGLVLRWTIKQDFPPLSAWRRRTIRAIYAGLVLGTGRIIWVVWPVHFTPNMQVESFVGGWILLWAGIWAGWWKLGNKPFLVSSMFGRRLSRTYVLDRMWFCTWFLGRRVFLVWHIGFHAHIFSLMNVGQFQTGMLSATIVFLEGHEAAVILRHIGRGLARLGVPFIPASVARGDPPLRAQNATLPHLPRDTAQLPRSALLVGLGTGLAGVMAKVYAPEAVDFRWVWAGGVGYMAAVAYSYARRARGTRLPVVDPHSGHPTAPWAYGPAGRFIVGFVTAWHLTAVSVWLTPNKDSLKAFRGPARKVFAKWLTVTTTDQTWGMFAPNPPRNNVFMKVLVTDVRGEVWDLRTDLYAQEQKKHPWIWNTRVRKMNRRIIGAASAPTAWYRKWHARWQCRQWALEHDGEAPAKVELIKVWYSIPTPEQMRKQGYYIAEERLAKSGKQRVQYTEHCASAVMGQLPNRIRERHGLDPLPAGIEYRPWIRRKKRPWDNQAEPPARNKKDNPSQ